MALPALLLASYFVVGAFPSVDVTPAERVTLRFLEGGSVPRQPTASLLKLSREQDEASRSRGHPAGSEHT